MNDWGEEGAAKMSMRKQGLAQTGALRMDQEHVVLLEMLERVANTCAIANADDCRRCSFACRDRCTAQLRSVLEGLDIYMRRHFKYEERQMDWYVPNDLLAEHRNAHADISAEIRGVIDRHCRDAADSATTAKMLVACLSAWLREHAREQDTMLAVFIEDTDDADDEDFID
jgi:hemerythrin-like metal-binding protein